MLSILSLDEFQPLSDLEADAVCGGIDVRTEALLSRGINRISVDLRDFVKPEFRDKDALPNQCKGDLTAGTLTITCDVKKYVVGEGLVPFDVPLQP